MHESKRLDAGRGAVGMRAVLGIGEREGRVAAKPIYGAGSQTVQAELPNTVEQGATLHTDEHGAYSGLEEIYKQEAVKHSATGFVNETARANGAESVWAALQRRCDGVCHQWSEKHMRRRGDEFVFRPNQGNARNHTMVRLDHIIRNAVGKRLTCGESLR